MNKVALGVKKVQLVALATLLSLSSLLSAVAFSPQVLAYAGGDGTGGNPWQIANCTQLVQMGYEWTDGDADDNYMLANDIDCTGVTFESIKFGESQLPFNGEFDGAGYTIRNVTINQGSDTYVGLFGMLDYATVENLTLSNVNVTGSYRVGALAGRSSESVIENVHVASSSVTATGVEEVGVGGLVGISDWSTYSEVTANVSVTGSSMWGVGGLIGSSFIDELYRTASFGGVTGYYDVGGLIGYRDCSLAESNAISQSFAHGSVTGNTNVGGFIGNIAANECPGARVIDSYARGSVTGNTNVGGFVGSHDGGAIYHSYSTGFIDSPAESVGGFASNLGEWSDEAIDSFWDTQTSGLVDSADGTGRTTTQMKTQNTFPWDFEGVWGMQPEWNDGYPCLGWSEDSCGLGEEESGDDDNVSTEVENNAPNSGDANGDEVADSEQPNVASFVNPVTDDYTVVALPSACSLTNASAESESDTTKDTGYSYNTGLVDFSADCSAGSIQVKVYQFGTGSNGLVLRKFNPTTGVYATITDAQIQTQVIGGQTAVVATYTIVDNGPLDLDPAVGSITDPVGFATIVGVPNTGFGGSRL